MRSDGQGVRDPPDGLRPDVLHLSIAAHPLSVRDGLAQMMLWASAHFGSEEARGAAEIVLAEVLNNIVEHAYPRRRDVGPPKGPSAARCERPNAGPTMGLQKGQGVSITLTKSAAGLICLVEDGGAMLQGGLPAGFALPDPAELPEGGFGWPLIRALCQDLHYERAGGLNRLRFTLASRQSGECDAIV